MAIVRDPHPRFELADGRLGTEREALTELLARREADLRCLQQEIETLRQRAATTDGADG